MPEYTAFELSEARQKQMVEDAVKEHNPESENECQLVADKCRIKENLRKSRVHHTVRVKSKLP